MNSKKAFFVMLASIFLLIALCGVLTYFGYKMIVKEGDKLEEAKLQAYVADEKKELLDQATRDIAKYEELESIAKTVVPQQKDQAKTVLEIVELGKKAGINITSVQFPASELGEVKKKTGPATARNNTKNNHDLTQLTAVEGLNGVYEMTINITADPQIPVRYNQLISYLKLLENNRRTAQVSNISITPNEDLKGFVTFQLSLRIFVKP